MAFADPQTITIAATPYTLARVSVVDNSSRYQKDDGTAKLTASHRPGKTRTQSTLRFDFTKTAADPLLAGVNRTETVSFFLNEDAPNVGFSITERKDIAQAVMTAVNASSGALLVKWLGGES